MLGREKGEVVQVVVGKATVEGDGVTFFEIHMLVHPAILDVAFAAPPNAKQCERESSPVADELAQEDGLTIQIDACHLDRKVRQPGSDFFGEIGLDDLIGIKPHHPFRGNWGVFQSPFELPRVVLEGMEQYLCTARLSQLYRVVGGEGVDDKDLARTPSHMVERTRQMNRFVE